MSDEIYFSSSDIFPIEDTLCKNCVHRMSRRLVPIDPETMGFTEDMVDDIVGEDGELVIDQHTCLVNNQDMDYVVTNCNKYTPKGAGFFVDPRSQF